MRRKNLAWSALFLASIIMAPVAAAGPAKGGEVLLASLSLIWSPDIFASIAIWLAIFGQIWLRLASVKNMFQNIIEI